ncbi:hypothetical protein PTTG_26508 [Puccinia triticina 1-1 BBBD Race 1]|uniref:Uncharacterized protein n=1 Tax=Puccinia triticina (isolate 1-1 / race 1 (BBBD)) TaxID=630390 RepID=A0A180GTS2_PUCT1|nr:hypothetical protein PTTG_26508 [Puccinia triticina 1-1 BBBD Race 1]WAR54997.1 hypothetical protein PtB15_4B615 [Puccinia triticina]
MRRSPAPQNNGKPPKFSTAALLGAPRTKFIQNNIIGVNPNTTPQKPPRQQFWAAKFQEQLNWLKNNQLWSFGTIARPR